MKNIFWVICLLFTTSCAVSAPQSNNKFDIMTSNNISEIENYIVITRKSDPKLSTLKAKLIALKTKKLSNEEKKRIAALSKPIILEIPKNIANNTSEAEEFSKLMSETSTAHKEKTVKLLNQMFNSDITNKEAILLIQNNSDCNMIVKIQGKDKFYTIAIPLHGQNSVVVNKGDYNLNSSVCGVKYISDKKIQKNMMVVLNSPNLNKSLNSKFTSAVSN